MVPQLSLLNSHTAPLSFLLFCMVLQTFVTCYLYVSSFTAGFNSFLDFFNIECNILWIGDYAYFLLKSVSSEMYG